jgi:hypothetical protein
MVMAPLRLSLCAAAGLAAMALTPCAGLAQPASDEVVSTAQGGTGATPPTASTSSVVAITPRRGDDLSRDGPLPDHKVHGEVTVGVGTNGYREVSGAVAGPIGKDGDMMIAIDVGSENYGRRH